MMLTGRRGGGEGWCRFRNNTRVARPRRVPLHAEDDGKPARRSSPGRPLRRARAPLCAARLFRGHRSVGGGLSRQLPALHGTRTLRPEERRGGKKGGRKGKS